MASDEDKRFICEHVYGGQWSGRHCTITVTNPTNMTTSLHVAFVDEEHDPVVQTIDAVNALNEPD